MHEQTYYDIQGFPKFTKYKLSFGLKDINFHIYLPEKLLQFVGARMHVCVCVCVYAYVCVRACVLGTCYISAIIVL